MTAKKKAAWGGGITLASIVAVLALWPQVEPLASWAINNLGVILAREQVQAVLASLSIGVLTGVFLPRWMPEDWSPAKTRSVTGLVCAGITFGAAIALVPTRVGTVYAVLAAVATPTASEAIAGIWYWLRPCAKPESLQP